MPRRLDNCLMLLPGRRTGKGSLEIEGRHISKLEFDDSVKPEFLVVPGLVNCHGHTAMTLVRGLGGGLRLENWLKEAIFPVEARMKPKHIRAGAAWGALEMLASGTTTVADMYDFPAEGEEAFVWAGIKANTCRVGLSFVPGRLDECVDFVSSSSLADKEGQLIKRDICVHSEYLTDEKFCKALAQANVKFKRPVHVHVSETADEHEKCLQRHSKTPTAFLADCGLFEYGGYAAHCVHCTDEDFEIMRQKGVTLVHNPSSNLKLGSGIARIVRAKELGVNIAIGTDGCASNDDLDMFEEMRLAALLASGTTGNPAALSAWDIIEMATENGAKALGRHDTGKIEVGYLADLAVLDLKSLHLSPVLDAALLTVYSAHSSDVQMTFVNGKQVYERGDTCKEQMLKEEFITSVNEIGLESLV